MSAQPDNQLLEGPLAELLIDLAFDYYAPSAVPFAPIVGASWERFSLSGYQGAIALDGSTLSAYIDAEGPVAFHALHQMMNLRNQPIEVQLADASCITADFANMRRLGERAEISLHHWAWRTERSTIAWIGRLEGTVPSFGNLALVEQGPNWSRSTRTAFRFTGAYVWHALLSSNGMPTRVIIDCGLDFPGTPIHDGRRSAFERPCRTGRRSQALRRPGIGNTRTFPN